VTPAVFAGTPEERQIGLFRHLTSEGLDVYVHPSLDIDPEGMEILLDKYTFMKRLRVRGVSIR
jgi:hypothetical protein